MHMAPIQNLPMYSQYPPYVHQYPLQWALPFTPGVTSNDAPVSSLNPQLIGLVSDSNSANFCFKVSQGVVADESDR